MPYKKIAQILATYDWQHLSADELASKLEKDMPEILKELSVSAGYLCDWYQKSLVDETAPPVWTDEHIEEVSNDFYLIPKQEDQRN